MSTPHACVDVDDGRGANYSLLGGDLQSESGGSTISTAPTALKAKKWTGAAVFVLLISLTVADIVLGALLFDTFGETYAQYLNLATALVYCVGSTAVLVVRRVRRGRRAAAPCPWYMLVGIGVLNGLGNFLQAVGQPHTPGLTQSLLTTTTVPLVLALSFVALKKSCSRIACGGALLIVAGAAVSALRTQLNSGGGDVVVKFDKDDDGGGISVFWYSIALFASAQLVFSVERVVEDGVFHRYLAGVDALTMFCWTMWTQFVFYLPLLPTQQLGVLGGLKLRDIPRVEWDGVRCTLAETSHYPAHVSLPRCSTRAAALFLAYVSVDGCCYCFGLYCIRRFGANAMVLASAVALPLQQVVFCLPLFVGVKLAETLFGSDLAALALVVAGFLVYHRLSPEGKEP